VIYYTDVFSYGHSQSKIKSPINLFDVKKSSLHCATSKTSMGTTVTIMF